MCTQSLLKALQIALAFWVSSFLTVTSGLLIIINSLTFKANLLQSSGEEWITFSPKCHLILEVPETGIFLVQRHHIVLDIGQDVSIPQALINLLIILIK